VSNFNQSVLEIDCERESSRIGTTVRDAVAGNLKRRGVVVGVSGGIDSAVCATLAVRALGADRVCALLMPEQDFASDGTERAKALCAQLGLEYQIEDIGDTLQALGCYQRRDAAIRQLFPEYGPGYRQKIAVSADLLDSDRLNYFNLIIESPEGERKQARMPLHVYLQVVAATNMKQRTRKTIEYYHAERLNYGVLGTPNRLEYELGFFVRGGDGLADLKPIAHLYKTQVYALAAYLGVPEEIQQQPPSTDTYSLPQTQEEFYFALDFDQMDKLLWAFNHDVGAGDVAREMNLSAVQVERVYRDISGKKRVAARSLQNALLVEGAD
jgi:NAD+ synthase